MRFGRKMTAQKNEARGSLRVSFCHPMFLPSLFWAGEALAPEHQISDLVNAAYGLTPEEIALMWQPAPPRMPIGNPGR